MRKTLLITSIVLIIWNVSFSQSALTIPKIMEGENFVGHSPSNIYWGEHGEYLYFNWNPDNNPGDSLYRVTMTNTSPEMVSAADEMKMPSTNGEYNSDKSMKVYSKNGDLFIYDLKTRKEKQITNTLDRESSPSFSQNQEKIFYTMSGNLMSWHMSSGVTTQRTNFKSGSEKREGKTPENEEWVGKEEMELIQILKERKDKSDARIKSNDRNEVKRPLTIYTGKASASNFQISPTEQYITYSLSERPSDGKGTKVPNYVTESGYIEDLNSRPKVGSPTSDMSVGIYDVVNDTSYAVSTKELPNIDVHPDFVKNKDKKREVYVHAPIWSTSGNDAIVVVRSKDNKDRWICSLDVATGNLKSLDHQHDDAWIGGPGIGWSQWDRTLGWMPDNKSIWFQSEATGYSHLYTLNVKSGKKKALTKGDFEIYNPRISNNKTAWYFESNEPHPGERYVYTMPIDGGKVTKLTEGLGRYDAFFSPDDSKIALLYSDATHPWELFVMENKTGAEMKKITSSTTAEFDNYKWRTPEYINFKAADGANVHARLYKPANTTNGPAVVFVHGAGYLQNAHKWWSSYYREYMFHNYLVDNGYTVLDIDYRASAGYGRDWRTGIYQHMGGLDLSDQVDGAKFLVESHNIDAKRIGIYGGSYGGFITLMAMFNTPDVFAAGAALRSVTDWAHYNHGYTSNILNTPVEDPEAYRKSSPIYFAEGLKGSLLMCHGMIDTNVQFQDIVRLSQRFIELGKTNWELAVYPLEGHGFVEPSSWTDEYSRIFKLFEENLK